MEWSKIKNVLIIGLIITNAFLGIYIYSSDNLFKARKITEDQSIKEVIKILEKKNIFLEMDDLTYYTKINDLELAYQKYEYSNLAENFLNKNYLVENDFYEDEKFSLEINDIELLYKNKEFNIKNELNLSKPLNLKIDQAVTLAKNFISDKGFSNSDYYVSTKKIINNTIEIIFKQKYKDFYLDESYMVFYIDSNGIEQFSRKWFDVKNISSFTKDVIPPSEALFDLLKNYSKNENRIEIKNIELGYKLDSDTSNSIVTSGDAFPYWRITFKSGRIEYTKAVQN